MALPLESSGFKDMVVVLGAAGLVIPAFSALRISPVIGFILVGVAAGPFGLGQLPGLDWLALSNPASLAAPAELGVALLLFALGLELSLDRIRGLDHHKTPVLENPSADLADDRGVIGYHEQFHPVCSILPVASFSHVSCQDFPKNTFPAGLVSGRVNGR